MAFTLANSPVPRVKSTDGVSGYWIDPTTRKGQINQQQGAITEAYWVTADQVDDFVLFCAGAPQTYGVGGASTKAPIPVSWYKNQNFYAQEISWEMYAAGPVQWTIDQPYSVGLVTITYGTIPYAMDGDGAFLSVECEVGGNFVSIPGSVYTFSDGTACEVGAGNFVPEMTYAITQYRQPSVDLAAMVGLAGGVNNAPYSIKQYSFAQETLLYGGGSWSIQQSLIGSPLYTVSHKVSWRPYSWNWALHPKPTVGWAEILDGNSNPPFAKMDFTTLFPAGGL